MVSWNDHGWNGNYHNNGQVFQKTPFIMGNDSIDQILKVSKLMGTQEVVNFIKMNKLSEKKGHKKDNICFDILVAFQNGDIAAEDPAEFDQFCTPANEDNCTWESLDMIKRLLVLDWVIMDYIVELKIYSKASPGTSIL